jgi:hypothetical protein
MKKNKFLYWGLIAAFFLLYIFVAFVSTLHAISFFELTNIPYMAVLLAIAYEIGQASVLFAILMTENKTKLLAWLMMILLTSVQVVGNVYASFKFMDSSGSNDWTFWQRSILFWLEADGPEMFKVIISWITGALLPIVALGMTALVAENLKLKDEQDEKIPNKIVPKIVPEINEEELLYEQNPLDLQNKTEEKTPTDLVREAEEEIDERTRRLEELRKHLLDNQVKYPEHNWNIEPSIAKEPEPEPAPPFPLSENIKEAFPEPNDIVKNLAKDVKETPMLKLGDKVEKTPKNHPRGWHLKKEHVDDNGDVYSFGKYVGEIKEDPPKKAKG